MEGSSIPVFCTHVSVCWFGFLAGQAGRKDYRRAARLQSHESRIYCSHSGNDPAPARSLGAHFAAQPHDARQRALGARRQAGLRGRLFPFGKHRFLGLMLLRARLRC